jgi:DNA polymerase
MVDLMIVGEAPSHTRPEGMEHVNFSGRTSYILWNELKRYDITRENCFVTNVVDKQLQRGQKPSSEMIVANRSRLQSEIEENEPLLILAVGKTAAEAILDREIKIVDVEPQVMWSERYSIWTLPCIHPGAVARNLSYLKPQFQKYIWLAANALDICRSYGVRLKNEYSKQRGDRK